MSIDLRKMSKADLDKLNVEIARYKAARGERPVIESSSLSANGEFTSSGQVTEIADTQPAQQLELL